MPLLPFRPRFERAQRLRQLLTARPALKHRFRVKLMPDQPAGIFESCGIKVHWALPHHGQSKPIERLHREIRDRVDKHPKLARAAAREHAVPLEVFLSVLDEQMHAIRIKAGRRVKNCGGRGFWATFEEGLNTVARRMPTAQQKRLFLLAVQNVLVISRDGSFKLAESEIAPLVFKMTGLLAMFTKLANSFEESTGGDASQS